MDYDYYYGAGLDDRGLAPKRFASDELRFTGIDLTPANSRARMRRLKTAYDEDTDPDYEEPDDGRGPSHAPPGMQLMLRDKEDILVERALERIARARALGKTNVKLSQAEIDALERAEQKNQRPAPPPVPKPVPKSKKVVQTRPKAQERKKSKGEKSSSNSPKVKAIEAARGGTPEAEAQQDLERALLCHILSCQKRTIHHQADMTARVTLCQLLSVRVHMALPRERPHHIRFDRSSHAPHQYLLPFNSTM